MELLVLLLPVATIAVAAGRWTRLHPLVVGAIIGVVPGLLAALATAGFMAGGATVLLAGGVLFLVSGGVSAFGAWMGRLRRQHIERIGQ